MTNNRRKDLIYGFKEKLRDFIEHTFSNNVPHPPSPILLAVTCDKRGEDNLFPSIPLFEYPRPVHHQVISTFINTIHPEAIAIVAQCKLSDLNKKDSSDKCIVLSIQTKDMKDDEMIIWKNINGSFLLEDKNLSTKEPISGFYADLFSKSKTNYSKTLKQPYFFSDN